MKLVRYAEFPGGLAKLIVRDRLGTHVEPHVWMVHRVD